MLYSVFHGLKAVATKIIEEKNPTFFRPKLKKENAGIEKTTTDL